MTGAGGAREQIFWLEFPHEQETFKLKARLMFPTAAAAQGNWDGIPHGKERAKKVDPRVSPGLSPSLTPSKSPKWVHAQPQMGPPQPQKPKPWGMTRLRRMARFFVMDEAKKKQRSACCSAVSVLFVEVNNFVHKRS